MSSKMGSHNSEAKPDKQMGRLSGALTSTVSKTAKRVAARKRRQHGRKVIKEES